MKTLSRAANLLAWIIGSIVSVAVYQYIAVYLFGAFDHSYGKLASFQLGLILFLALAVAGLVGYAAIASFRQRSVSLIAAFFAGVVFAVCVCAVGPIVGRAFPYNDMTIPAFAGALLLGALSTFVARPSAA